MRNKQVQNGLIALVLMISLLSSAYVLRTPPLIIPDETEPEPQSPAIEALYKRIGVIHTMMDEQKEIDLNLLSALNSGDYGIENPLVVINPYKVSPLTAVILFETSEPSSVSIKVHGKTDSQSLSYTFESFETLHSLPVFGLYGDALNRVTLTSTDQQGKSITTEVSLQTEMIPEILETNIFTTYQSGLPMSPGFTFTFGNGYSNYLKTAIDAVGDYRWVLTMDSDLFADYQNGNNLIFTFGNTMGHMLFVEMNYLGKIINVYYSPYGCHHDIVVTDDSLLVTGSNNVPNSVEDFIYEIDRTSGNITKTLDYKTVLLRTRQVNKQYSNQDWMHMNSIVEDRDDVIISSNFQSAIVKNDWLGNIKWILSEPSAYTTKYQPYLLRPVGKNFLYPFNQHAAEVLPDTDGNPDTIDLLLFDNGTSRYAMDEELQRRIAAHEVTPPVLFSRMVIYRINEKAMTVEQVWQYGQHRPELYSSAKGDANLLDNGNYLGLFQVKGNAFDDENSHAVYIEVSPSGKVVWEVLASSSNQQNSFIEYRAERFELYNSNSSNLNLGLSANNLIPKDLFDGALVSTERNNP